MILLDTDHLSILQLPDSDRRQRLIARMEASPDQEFGATIIAVEEQMRGWLAAIAKEREARRQIAAYRELARLFEFFSQFHLALFDDPAAARYEELRSQRIRIGTMDLKMAAIAQARAVLLLTANQRDFSKVPGLRLENWLD